MIRLRNFPSKFWVLAACLLIFATALQLSSMLHESATFDEGMFVASGYSYLTTSDYRLNPDHPPLTKLLAGTSLLLFGGHLKLPLDDQAWAKGEAFGFGWDFFHVNGNASTLTNLGRLPTVLLSVILGLAVLLWTRKHLGSRSALLAATLLLLDPTILSHGHYATTDFALATFAFLSCIAWHDVLIQESGVVAGLLPGVLLGCAFASKFSSVILIPVFIVMSVAATAKARFSGRSIKRVIALAAVVTATALCVLTLMYQPWRRQTFYNLPLTAYVEHDNTVGRALYFLAQHRLPAHPLWVGLSQLAAHNAHGHCTYILGRRSILGWWYYFPFAYLVKEPLAILLGVVILFGVACSWLLRRPHRVNFAVLTLAVPVILFWAAAIPAHLNIGIRHVLSVYPFTAVLIAVSCDRLPKPYNLSCVVLPVLLCVEVLFAWPAYLSFFNIAAGGNNNGHKLLLDSNLDWGQDLKRLRAFSRQHPQTPLCLAYFGTQDPLQWGIHARTLGFGDTLSACERSGVFVVSATFLHDVYTPWPFMQPQSYSWLLNRRPEARIGDSLFVYKLSDIARWQ